MVSVGAGAGRESSDRTRFDTQDSLFDISWSEAHENQLVAACGDGSIKMFDIGIDDWPIHEWREHQREVFSVHWNLVSKDRFCSSSWDGTIKIVSPLLLCSLSISVGA